MPMRARTGEPVVECARAGSGAADARGRGIMRVLLVEDYLPIQKAIARGLREAGFAVDVTGDGQEALWFATENDYDVVMLDLMLPRLDGLAVLQRMRAQGRPAPVLILTAKDAVADRVRGLDLGADDYLVKPFAFEELLARVRALARRAYQARNPCIEIGGLRIDTAAQRVRYGSQELRLTARAAAGVFTIRLVLPAAD